MLLSLRITRAPSIRMGVGDPLSNTMTSRAPAIDCMQARSISPPPDASSTIASTPLMIHPVEVHRACQRPQLDPPAPRDVHADAAVTVRRRQDVGLAANLDGGGGIGGVLQRRWSTPGQKAERVARPPSHHETDRQDDRQDCGADETSGAKNE